MANNAEGEMLLTRIREALAAVLSGSPLPESAASTLIFALLTSTAVLCEEDREVRLRIMRRGSDFLEQITGSKPEVGH